MRLVRCVAGSKEWVAARLGVPTASQFNRLVTPKRGDMSKQIAGYARELAIERVLGEPLDTAASQYMQRGTELEAHAFAYYDFEVDASAERAPGVFVDDELRAACSPDGLVEDDGLVEIKCLGAKHHADVMLDGIETLYDEYRCQVQGQLMITGRRWNDLLAFHPSHKMRSIISRFQPDLEFQAKLREAIVECNRLADEIEAELRAQAQ